MNTFLQTSYRNTLLDIKRLAETEEFSPSTLLYLIETAASTALRIPS
jgi:hypothetical protein